MKVKVTKAENLLPATLQLWPVPEKRISTVSYLLFSRVRIATECEPVRKVKNSNACRHDGTKNPACAGTINNNLKKLTGSGPFISVVRGREQKMMLGMS
jgi:hypothetical protein